MTNLPPREPEAWKEIPGAFLSLIKISLSELRRDVDALLKSDWGEPHRRRAHELASVLDQACSRQGLTELAGLARSMAGLARLSRKEAMPLLSELKAKFGELLGLAERIAAQVSKRYSNG